jgi:hypothetical protein
MEARDRKEPACQFASSDPDVTVNNCADLTFMIGEILRNGRQETVLAAAILAPVRSLQ